MATSHTPDPSHDESPNEGIVVYGTSWCPDCWRAKKFLDKVGIPYRWVDVDHDADSRALVQRLNHGRRSVPTIVFPDGSILVEPSNQDLASKTSILQSRDGGRT